MGGLAQVRAYKIDWLPPSSLCLMPQRITFPFYQSVTVLTSLDLLAVRTMSSIDPVTVDMIYDFIGITWNDHLSNTSTDSKTVRDRILTDLKIRLGSNTQGRHDFTEAFANAKARVKAMVAEESLQSQLKQVSESLEETTRKLEKTLTASCKVQESTNTTAKTSGPALLAQREKRKRDYEDLDRQFNGLEQLRKKWKSARATAKPEAP